MATIYNSFQNNGHFCILPLCPFCSHVVHTNLQGADLEFILKGQCLRGDGPRMKHKIWTEIITISE